MSNDSNKRNILASLMQRQSQPGEAENLRPSLTGCGPARPTSVVSNSSMRSTPSKQHKLSKRFTVIRKLGKGTYGKVQLAINKQTGQEVAIKTIKKSKIDSEEDMQRVRREIQIMRSIEHPHIIHIYEEFENKDKIVLIMQYAPGGELYEYVSQFKGLDDGEARRLFRQIATAIYYCHQNKICHRDLKLENILLDEKNNAKLADFGLSNVFDKQSQLKTFCGSPLYASPEIVQGSPYSGPEVDCWSLGVLLYTLVYGAMPFDGSNFKRLVKQISDASYYEPNEKSPASPLIRQLLCADAKRRATIVDICSDPWVNGTPSSPLSPSVRLEASRAIGGETQHPLPHPHQHQHPSLLKVAQDMANLTPVRMDMLMELTLGEQAARRQREAEAAKPRPPLAPVSDNAATKEAKEQECPGKQTSCLDPSTVMEVDELRTTSPIASYIVRDMEQESAGQEQALSQVMPQEEVDELEPEVAEISVEQEPVSKVVVEDSPSGAVIEIVAIEQSMDAIEQSTGDGCADQAESATSHQLVLEHTEPSEDQSTEKASEDVEAKMEVDAQDKVVPPPSSPPNNERDSQAQVSSAAAKAEEEIPGNSEQASADKDQEEPGKENVQLDLRETDEGGEIGSKPKKVKKKIIVVKKKKKVAKKDAASEIVGNKQQATEENEDKIDNDQATGTTKEQQVISEQKSGGRPGRVKIPDTFQTGASEPEPQVQQAVPVASSGGQQGRRQSALIADVSQRLLQSVSAESRPAASTMRESDQFQLKDVRVADKRDDLERRASLAQQQAELHLAAAQQSRSVSPADIAAEQQVEALQAELVREMQSSEAADQVQLDQVQTLEPHSAGPAAPYAGAQLANEEPNKLLQSPPTDERSDSLETIKADNQMTRQEEEADDDDDDVERQAQRSVQSIGQQVNSSPMRDVRQDQWQEQRAADLPTPEPTTADSGGPAPMARSYKKVTFTKDGACITETGKIYSTQADDGTLRRVERKSKVTHYPAQPGHTGNSSTSRTHKEELVFCEGAPKSSKIHLQRLIMPSRLANDDSDSDNDVDFLSSSRGSSSLFRQEQRKHERKQHQGQAINRTGSGSSCSSGSTDVLDDIFDSWTGAISMFDRPSLRLFGRAPSDCFGRRRHRVSSSQAGTPRCESVEPSIGAKQRPEQQQQQRSSSGYESDVGGGGGGRRGHQRRPRPGWSQMASSARGQFGSWNLLNDLDDDGAGEEEKEHFFGNLRGERRSKQPDVFATSGFTRDPFEILEREQRSLRERLARQHKQLWKGSTPSLFDDFTFAGAEPTGTSRKPPAVRDPRLPTGSGVSCHRVPGDLGRMDQSQWSSSGGNLQKHSVRPSATPLDAAPTRRNTTNVCAGEIRKSISSGQTVKTSQSFAPDGRGEVSIQTSTLIELKRAPSSLGSSSQAASPKSSSSGLKIRQQQQQQRRAPISGSFKDESTSSSSLWNNRGTPSAAADSLEAGNSTLASGTITPPANNPTRQSPVRDSIDRRVQSWLQESSGNLSATSSGSKSSQSASISDSAHSTNRRAQDPFDNLYGSLWQTTCTSSRTKLQDASALPPQVSPMSAGQTGRTSRSSIVLQQADGLTLQQKVLRHSTSGNVVVSKQQQSIVESAECSDRSARSQVTSVLLERSSQNEDTINRDEGQTSKVATSYSSSVVMRQSELRSASPLIETRLPDTFGPPKTGSGEHQMRWMQQSVEQTASRVLAGSQGEDLFTDLDSMSGDLESRSSSSLLDQLKAKGYRSMINKRLVDISDSTAKSSSAGKQVIDTEGATRKVASRTIVEESYSRSSSRVSKQFGPDVAEQSEEANKDPWIVASASGTQLEPTCQLLTPSEPLVQSSSELRAGAGAGAGAGAEIAEAEAVLATAASKQSQTEQGSREIKEMSAPEEIPDEEDEDVREAKASLKCHLDRIKETELFLKSLRKDEENYERQRQQMLLFNDLMLGHRLSNGFKMSANHCATMDLSQDNLGQPGADCGLYRKSTGPRSAPVRSYLGENGEQENGFLASSSQFSSAALGFEPTYVLPATSNPYKAAPELCSRYQDPFLEPVQPICGLLLSQKAPGVHYERSTSPFDPSPQPLDRFRRSRSQLSDQFASYKRVQASKPAQLKESTIPGSPIVTPTSASIYYPSRAKRSMSQLRYNSNRLSQPVAMSEYRSAFGNPSLIDQSSSLCISPNVSPEIEPSSRSKHDIVGHDDDDDDGMSAYRASSYVPKIVPATTDRGRSREKRHSYLATSKDVSGNEQDQSLLTARQRRSSLQVAYGSVCGNRSGQPTQLRAKESEVLDDTSSSPDLEVRRRSLTRGADCSQRPADSSRLTELEQRIKENKRRREELLSGKLSPDRSSMLSDSTDQLNESGSSRKRRESSPAASPARASASVGLMNRPSRLESMEARIKRKSYCVRVGDCSPERTQSQRNQVSLEKWRQTNHQMGGGLSNRLESFATDSSSNLLLSNMRRSSISTVGTSKYQEHTCNDD